MSPVTTDSATELGTARSISSGHASRLGADDARGLTKNRLTSAGNRWRAGVGRSRGRGLVGCGSIFAAILAAIGNETMAIRGTTVSIRRAAASVSTVCVASGSVEVLSAAAIVPGRSGTSLWLGCSYRSDDRWLSTIVAARLASIAAVCWATATPSVLTAAGSSVDGRVRVAQEVAIGRSAFAILRVLCVLPLHGESDRRMGPRGNLGVVALGVGSAAI